MLHGKRSLGLAVGILMISIEIVEVKSSRKKLDPGHRNSSGQVERLYKEVDSRMIKNNLVQEGKKGWQGEEDVLRQRKLISQEKRSTNWKSLSWACVRDGMSIFWHIWIGACATSFEEIGPRSSWKIILWPFNKHSCRGFKHGSEALRPWLPRWERKAFTCWDLLLFCSPLGYHLVQEVEEGLCLYWEKYARRVDQNREFGIVTNILEAEVVGENYNKITRWRFCTSKHGLFLPS